MKIPVSDSVHLDEFRPSDEVDCVAALADREIADRTLLIPYPYTAAHFAEWLDRLAASTEQHGEPVHFAIRRQERLIGAIGFKELVRGHRAELGYWLAKPWWGRGIMTDVVRTACQFAFAQWRLVRITALVFEGNDASARVLEKNGFVCEGRLRKHHRKDGRFLDARLYALVR